MGMAVWWCNARSHDRHRERRRCRTPGEDLPHHLPRIETFWRGVLFGDRSYTGDPMTAHIALNKRHPMEQQHFDRWIAHWNATLAELFSGPKAEEAKARAATIAPVMAWKVKNR